MFVAYKCEHCRADVNNNMKVCPKCGAELPEFSLYRGYGAEIDEELYEQERPIRTQFRKLLGPYGEHLLSVVIEDANVEASVERKVAQIRSERGKWAARWYVIKRKVLMLLFAIGYIGLIVFSVVPMEHVENERLAYVLWGFIFLFPLFAVSVWLLVQRDNRNVQLGTKIVQNAWGAFNKLAFGILYVVAIIFIVTFVREFLFSYFE